MNGGSSEDSPSVLAVDTSALMAVLLAEPTALACRDALVQAERLLISAGTVAEALIVAARRGIGPAMQALLDNLDCDVQPVTHAAARRVALAYERWGKGLHPAGLNYGDCFAYEVAHTQGCPLLYVGDDFRRTDLAGRA